MSKRFLFNNELEGSFGRINTISFFCKEDMIEIIIIHSISEDKLISLLYFDLYFYIEDFGCLGPRICSTCLSFDDSEVLLKYKMSSFRGEYHVYIFGSEKKLKIST